MAIEKVKDLLPDRGVHVGSGSVARNLPGGCADANQSARAVGKRDVGGQISSTSGAPNGPPEATRAIATGKARPASAHAPPGAARMAAQQRGGAMKSWKAILAAASLIVAGAAWGQSYPSHP